MSFGYTPITSNGTASTPLYELVAEATIPSGTSMRQLHLEGLDGNTDGFYRIEYAIIASGLTAVLGRANGVTTGQNSSYIQFDGASATSANSSQGFFHFGQATNAGNDHLNGIIDVDVSYGRRRVATGQVTIGKASGSNAYGQVISGQWVDMHLNMTGILVHSTATDINGPSYIKVYRVNKPE
jgi:hypothetical protein